MTITRRRFTQLATAGVATALAAPAIAQVGWHVLRPCRWAGGACVDLDRRGRTSDSEDSEGTG